MASPITLNTRPLMCSPAGILIGAPVANTSTPLLRPSVESIEIARTVSSPMCCWHSNTSLVPFSLTISNESYISGKPASLFSKVTSTTGPMICDILPLFCDILLFLIVLKKMYFYAHKISANLSEIISLSQGFVQ